MILNRSFYNKTSFFKSFFSAMKMRKLTGTHLHRSFLLQKTEMPEKMYFYSPRLKRKPRFTGDIKLLANWKESKLCERMCPTNAIKVTQDDFIIDPLGCIKCGLCLEIAPPGILEMSPELNFTGSK